MGSITQVAVALWLAVSAVAPQPLEREAKQIEALLIEYGWYVLSETEAKRYWAHPDRPEETIDVRRGDWIPRGRYAHIVGLVMFPIR